MKEEPIMNFIPSYQCDRAFRSQSSFMEISKSYLESLFIGAVHPQYSFKENAYDVFSDIFTLGLTRNYIGKGVCDTIITKTLHGDKNLVIANNGEFAETFLKGIKRNLGKIENINFLNLLYRDLFDYADKNSGIFSWGGSLRTTENGGIESCLIKPVESLLFNSVDYNF